MSNNLAYLSRSKSHLLKLENFLVDAINNLSLHMFIVLLLTTSCFFSWPWMRLLCCWKGPEKITLCFMLWTWPADSDFTYHSWLYLQAADLTLPTDKRVYKGTFPTCHSFSELPEAGTDDPLLLLVGFSAGQIQLIDPIHHQTSLLFNQEVSFVLAVLFLTSPSSHRWVHVISSILTGD